MDGWKGWQTNVFLLLLLQLKTYLGPLSNMSHCSASVVGAANVTWWSPSDQISLTTIWLPVDNIKLVWHNRESGPGGGQRHYCHHCQVFCIIQLLANLLNFVMTIDPNVFETLQRNCYKTWVIQLEFIGNLWNTFEFVYCIIELLEL